MDLKRFANVDSFLRDLDTGREIAWEEYMRRVIDKLGLHNIEPYIPYDISFIRKKLKEDIHLNNTPIGVWDAAGGFSSIINKKMQTKIFKNTGYGISRLFINNGIRSFSPSDTVCVLKEAARILVKEVYDE